MSENCTFDKLSFQDLNSKNVKELAECFENIIELIDSPKNERTQRVDKAIEFLNLSRVDLNDARLLYDGKSYAGSIYHLQQATEKVVKAYAIYYFDLTYNDAKSIGHDTPEAFIKVITKYGKVLSPLFKIYEKLGLIKPDFFESFKSNTNDMFKSKNKKIRILRCDSVEIKSFLDYSDKFARELGTFNYEDNKTQIDRILRAFIDKTPQLSDNKELVDKLDEIENAMFDSIGCITATYLTRLPYLYFTAIVTYPHNKTTRYPGYDMKPEDYNENLGIVKCFEDVYSIVSDAVNFLSCDMYQTQSDRLGLSDLTNRSIISNSSQSINQT